MSLAWIAVKGAKQGQFKGEAAGARHDKWMAVLDFTMGVTAPRDTASGQASGKRQYQPVTIVKAWGAASPQAFTACATNEVLTEVDLEFTDVSGAGQVVVYQTVKLFNASLSQIARFIGNPPGIQNAAPANPDNARPVFPFERWTFVFQRIEVHDNDGNTSFTDSWTPAT